MLFASRCAPAPLRSQRRNALVLLIHLAAIAVLPAQAQKLPMQSQPPSQRQAIQEPELRPAETGNQTIQQLDTLLWQQQRQTTPAGTLQNLENLQQQQPR